MAFHEIHAPGGSYALLFQESKYNYESIGTSGSGVGHIGLDFVPNSKVVPKIIRAGSSLVIPTTFDMTGAPASRG